MSGDSTPIRVLAVDDHQLIRVGIATLLLPESDMKLVGEAIERAGSDCQIPGMPAGRHADGLADAGDEWF